MVAPAGWGRPYRAALSDAAQKGMCADVSAAALIGPCDESAALLRNTYDVAVAIRRWGQSTPDAPTAWMDALSAGERDRLRAIVHHDRRDLAHSLPWLPPDAASQTRITNDVIDEALSAFAEASPTAQALHAALVQRLVGQAQPDDLDALTRLACAMMSEEAWARAATLVQQSPDDASRVVAARAMG